MSVNFCLFAFRHFIKSGGNIFNITNRFALKACTHFYPYVMRGNSINLVKMDANLVSSFDSEIEAEKKNSGGIGQRFGNTEEIAETKLAIKIILKTFSKLHHKKYFPRGWWQWIFQIIENH